MNAPERAAYLQAGHEAAGAYDAGDFPRAIEQTLVALSLCNEDPRTTYNLALAYRRVGDCRMAAHWYEELLQQPVRGPWAVEIGHQQAKARKQLTDLQASCDEASSISKTAETSLEDPSADLAKSPIHRRTPLALAVGVVPHFGMATGPLYRADGHTRAVEHNMHYRLDGWETTSARLAAGASVQVGVGDLSVLELASWWDIARLAVAVTAGLQVRMAVSDHWQLGVGLGGGYGDIVTMVKTDRIGKARAKLGPWLATAAMSATYEFSRHLGVQFEARTILGVPARGVQVALMPAIRVAL